MFSTTKLLNVFTNKTLVLCIIYKKLDFSNPGCLMLKSVYNKFLNNKIYLLHATIESLLCTRFNAIFISIIILYNVVLDETISKLPPPTMTYLPTYITITANYRVRLLLYQQIFVFSLNIVVHNVLIVTTTLRGFSFRLWPKLTNGVSIYSG